MVTDRLAAFLPAALCLTTAAAADVHDYEVLSDQVYAQRESGDLTGDLYLPVVDDASPGIIMIHGGGWRRGNVDDMEKFARRVAASGFAVFNITYRLAPGHKFPAVVAGAGPTDLREYPDNKYVTALMPEDAGEELFALASPLAAVSGDAAAMFLYHGKRDWIVDYRNSVNMLEALRVAGVTARLRDMPFGHIMTYFFGGRAVDAGIDFLRTNL